MQEIVNILVKSFLTNPFVIAVLVLGLISLIFYRRIVGFFGESHTKSALRKLPKEYIVLNNVNITANGYHNQIDHVVVSKYGIFCIETKQYNGYITGSKWDKNWVRHYGNRKSYCINPIRQNYGHVKGLCTILNLTENEVFNIVCIPSNAKLNIQDDGEVTRYDTLNRKILSYREVLIDDIEEVVLNIKKNSYKDSNR